MGYTEGDSRVEVSVLGNLRASVTWLWRVPDLVLTWKGVDHESAGFKGDRMGLGELGALLWRNEAVKAGQMNDRLGVFFTKVVHLGISKIFGRGWIQGHW